MDTTWKLSWQRARNHEGVTRGARALVALAAVLAYGWWADWRAELMPVLLGLIASALTEPDFFALDEGCGFLRIFAPGY